MFLNIYCSEMTDQMFSRSEEASMTEKCQLAASEIASLEVLNQSTVAQAVSQIDSLKVSRLIVTDHTGVAIYDSSTDETAVGKIILFPEVVQALSGDGYDVFNWSYQKGITRSHAAVPVVSYGKLTGCVYMMDHDETEGALIERLQMSILIITIVLEAVVIVISVFYSTAFSARMRKIMTSMQIIREGDYSHKVQMGGRDELTVLGEEFNDLTDRLQTSEAKRRQFVSDASHELKTPLASIKLLSDSIMQNEMDMFTVREFVGDIGREADRLTRMSEKLLSLSRIETQQDSDCEIVYLSPTVERAIRMLEALAFQNGISIMTEMVEDCPVLTIEDDLYQITFNLMENAIKYTPPGGVITLSLYRENDNAVLKISDTGVGIPEDAIGHIFERFYRVDKARSRKSGGSGLGLSIVRNIVERNGGTISVESTLGKGTTFTVIFPAFDTDEEVEE